MKLLGAVLAGGRSSRFGSDKALAIVDGRALLDHAIMALAGQVEEVVVCGRDWPPRASIADVPAPGLGPLGGLCGALLEAARRGFDAVLCAPCDALQLPGDLVARLHPGPAVARDQWTVGLWPASCGSELLARLTGGDDRSIVAWVNASGARIVDCGPIGNINRPGDLPVTPFRLDSPTG